MIVENRAGANGAIAAGQLAKLPPDGQTLMMIVSGHVTNGHLNPKQPFDALKDFTPISRDRVVAAVDLRASELPGERHQVDAGARQGEAHTLAYSSPGTGSIQHLSMELLAYLAGAKLVHVPYRSGALALNDTLAGHVPLSVLSVFQALPHLQAKTIKPLAVTSAKATDILPGVPALAEAGAEGLRGRALVRGDRAGRPAARAHAKDQRRHRQDREVAGDAEEARRSGRAAGRQHAAEAAAFMKAESDKWGKVIKEANIKGE